MTNFDCLYYPKFADEKDKLIKKCPTLNEDLDRLKSTIIDDLISKNNNLPENIYVHVKSFKGLPPVFKVKKFRCRAIKKGNRSGFRIVFMYLRDLSLIYFIEIYHKNKKEDMDFKKSIFCL